MSNWTTRFFNLIRNLPSRATHMWPLRQFRKADIPPGLRDICERYGEDVIGMTLASGLGPRAKDLQTVYATDETIEHARTWLTERGRSRRWRDRITLSLEIVVVLLIGWEIYLGYQQERLQSRNSKEQQQVLTNLQTSSAATAKTFTSLQSATESMNTILQMQLDAAKKSAAQAERSAKAGEASASTASQALHVSERAYVYMTISLRKPPSPGEKLQISVVTGNVGRTSALELEVHSDTLLVSSSMSVNEALASPVTAQPPQKWVSLIVLQSGQATESLSELPHELNQSAFDKLTAGKMSLYVVATATYKDVFQQPHRTETCGVYHPKTNAFLNCHEHNKSD